MTDDVRADARRLLHGITEKRGWEVIPWGSGKEWMISELPEVEDGDQQQVVHATYSLGNAEFIAAAPALVDRLLTELDQERDRALRLAIRATGREKAETERDAALATLQQVREYCEREKECSADLARQLAEMNDGAALMREQAVAGFMRVILHILDGGAR